MSFLTWSAEIGLGDAGVREPWTPAESAISIISELGRKKKAHQIQLVT
jgi:hypothetical protein